MRNVFAELQDAPAPVPTGTQDYPHASPNLVPVARFRVSGHYLCLYRERAEPEYRNLRFYWHHQTEPLSRDPLTVTRAFDVLARVLESA